MANMKSIFSAIRAGSVYLSSLDQNQEVKRRSEALGKLKNFVYSGCYTQYRQKEEFLGCENEKEERIAKALGITVAGVRQARKRISDEAYAALGKEIVSDILYGDQMRVVSAERSIRILHEIYSARDFMFADVLDVIEGSSISDTVKEFNMNDCQLEMLFLRFYCRYQFFQFVEVLDADKLRFLVSKLRGGYDENGDKLMLLKYLFSGRLSDMGMLFERLMKVLSQKTSIDG